MLVVHTSKDERGQVYVPFVNVMLAIVCLLLVVTFRSSVRLAAAYGLAVACTMLATTIAFFVVATQVFHWPKRYVVPGISLFALIDTLFVTSGLPKFLDGAWVPLAVSAVVATISLTWLRGRRSLSRALAADQVPIPEYLEQHGQTTTPIGHSVLLTGDPTGIPFIRRHRWLPNFLDRKVVVLLNLVPADIPYVEQDQRVSIDRLAPALYVIRASFGYMEPPRLGPVLLGCDKEKLALDDEHTTFFYAQPVIIGKAQGGMRRGQRALFMWLSRVSRSLVDDLELPPDRRIGLGVEIQI
jgi:KUP system potassium uptake protein